MPRLAIVGVAHIHTPGFIHAIQQRDITVPFVTDHDHARAEIRAEALGAKVVSAEELLAQEVDGYLVLTETDRHLEWVRKLAPMGKPLFVEKPLGLAGADALEMAKLIEDAGIPFQTGYFARGDAKVRAIKHLVDTGAFGRITRVRASKCHSGALGRWFDTEWRWMADPAIAGVGAFGDLGTHGLDILLWLCGPAGAVTAQLDPGTATYEGCDETGEAMIRFRNGTIGTLAAAWVDRADPVQLMVSGTQAHAAIINGELVVSGCEAPAVEAAPAGLDSFLDLLEGKPAELVSASEAAERSVVMEAMYLADREDRWVRL